MPKSISFHFSKNTLLALVAYLLLPLAMASTAEAAVNVNLQWDQPRNTDGSLATNFTGYRIYFRLSSGSYNTTNRRTVSGPGVTTYQFTDLTPGTYYFKVHSYNQSPDTESLPSNDVGIHSLQPALEIGPVAARAFEVRLYNPGSATSFSTSTLTANSGGILTLPITSTMPAIVDIRVKTSGYLAAKRTNYTLTNLSALPALPAGDIDNSNRVDISDLAILNADWFTTNARSNYDSNATVNINDALYLNAHYFEQGAAQ